MNPAPGNKRVALQLLCAFTFIPVLLLLVAFTSNRAEGHGLPPVPPGILYAIDALILLGTAGYATTSLRQDLPRQRFLQTLIICLMMSEFASILAFFFLLSIGAPSMAPVVVGSILVNLFFIGPRVLVFARS